MVEAGGVAMDRSTLLWIGAVILALPATSNAQAYRCINAQGETVYQQSPCPDAASSREVPLIQSPSSQQSGLREAERRRLKEIEQREASRRARRMTEDIETIPRDKTCGGFDIIDVQPFERTSGALTGGTITGGQVIGDQIVGGNITGGSVHITKHQCANMTLKITGYDGRLLRLMGDTLKDEITGILENHQRRQARSVRLEGPSRWRRGDPVSARVCFGISDIPLSDAICQ